MLHPYNKLKQISFLSVFLISTLFIIAWKPANVKILTPFEEKIKPNNVLQEYPRPQMKRDKWMNLNGLWNYALTGNDTDPKKYADEILVPFCIESPLSGVQKQISRTDYIWYHKKITLPAQWKGKRILLHFGAVDWEAVVLVNGKQIGMHQGGYTPFYFDITDALKSRGEQEIKVRVNDHKSSIYALVGKQNRKAAGRETPAYETVSGIWQTVWHEPEEDIYI